MSLVFYAQNPQNAFLPCHFCPFLPQPTLKKREMREKKKKNKKRKEKKKVSRAFHCLSLHIVVITCQSRGDLVVQRLGMRRILYLRTLETSFKGGLCVFVGEFVYNCLICDINIYLIAYLVFFMCFLKMLIWLDLKSDAH